MLRIFFLLLFISSCYIGKSQVIASIQYEGLTKTDPTYLNALIDCKVGQTLDTNNIKRDVQTLKNLNLFFRVSHSYKLNAASQYDLIFEIEEAVYLYPILSVSGFKTQLKIQAGGNQINFLGRAQSIGALYQYYDRHSISFFYTAPRHANGKTGHELALAKYSTIEPLYFMDTVSNFNFDNYSVSVGGFYWLRKKVQLGLGGMYLWEKYEQLDNAEIGYIEDLFSFNKFQIRLQLDYQGINQHFEFMEGISTNLFTETIQTIENIEGASFFKATTAFKYFKRIGQRGNIGFSNHLGISSNTDSPFAPFVLDGFLNVRGIGNRVARGTAELILNAEYRYTVYKNKYAIVQLAAFGDYGTLREPGMGFSSLFDAAPNIFLGGGIRLHSRLIYKTIFRLDYSVNPGSTNDHGFTFGLGQFF